jgi:hypothetical protein
MSIDNAHFHELIFHWKQHSDDCTFKRLDEWYEKHYGHDTHAHIEAVLSIWTSYLENINAIRAHEVLEVLRPGQFWYSFFPDLDDETNAKVPYRVLAFYLSKLRLTKVVDIPGFRAYVDSLQS